MNCALRGLLTLGLVCASFNALSAVDDSWDLLIRGGRVVDPESGLNAVRDVAIKDGRIAAIDIEIDLSSTGFESQVIDARGRVVAPGFIDLHAHGASAKSREYQIKDGVTTALELEWGYADVDAFLRSRRGKSQVNFGASVSHGHLRALALRDKTKGRELRELFRRAAAAPEPLIASGQLLTEADNYSTLDPRQQVAVAQELKHGLAQGGIGIGMAHAYYPGADRSEIYAVFKAAAKLDTLIFTHARGRGMDAVQEVLANAAATGAALHIVHVNSTALGEIEPVLDLIQGARERGVDVSTEAYPYTAGSTLIQSALFDGDWQSAYGISYDALQWQATGERLTQQSFDAYRQQGGVLIIHMMKDPWIDTVIARDWVMVASDGMPYNPGAHPRTAGTFARLLGRYVRERNILDLSTAIRKVTLLPAQRLEAIAPQMSKKGRLQVGMDADLVIFDPGTVVDRATFEAGPQFSEGFEYVFVGGTAVVADGQLVADTFPGQAIMGRAAGP